MAITIFLLILAEDIQQTSEYSISFKWLLGWTTACWNGHISNILGELWDDDYYMWCQLETERTGFL